MVTVGFIDWEVEYMTVLLSCTDDTSVDDSCIMSEGQRTAVDC